MSIHMKKKEWLGNFFRAGGAFTEQTVETFNRGFGSAGKGKLIPQGISDLSRGHARE